jgi:hypothetical protein
MTSKWLAFDIETHSWPDGDDTRRDLGVTCVALALADGPVLHWPTVIDESGVFGERLLPGDIDRLVTDLCEYSADGYKIATINGLGFDFPVLAAEVSSLEMYDNLRDLALGSYDPAFQMLCERGFMVGLDAMAVGLELSERKTKDMSGAKAVDMWETDDLNQQRQVIEYVRQDARVALGIVQALEDQGILRWQTKRGCVSAHRLEHGLLTVRQCLELPLPDVEWMKARGSSPWPREKFSGWLDV